MDTQNQTLTPEQPPKKKRSLRQKLLIGLGSLISFIVLIVLIGVCSAGGGTDTQPTTPSAPSQSAPLLPDVQCLDGTLETVETLQRFPEASAGRCVRLEGRVSQVLSGDVVLFVDDQQFYVSNPTDQCLRGEAGRVLEDDHVAFIAVYRGVITIETVLGAERQIPSATCSRPATPTPRIAMATIGVPVAGEVLVNVVSAEFVSSYNYVSFSGTVRTDSAPVGRIFLLLDAEVTNTGDEGDFVGRVDFNAVDQAGISYDPAPFLGDDDLSSEFLSPNQRIRGKVLFELPATLNSVEVLLISMAAF